MEAIDPQVVQPTADAGAPATPIGQTGVPEHNTSPQVSQQQVEQAIQKAEDAGVSREEFERVQQWATSNQAIIDRLEQLAAEHDAKQAREVAATNRLGSLSQQLAAHADADDMETLATEIGPWVETQIDTEVEKALAAKNAELEEWYEAEVHPYIVHYNSYQMCEKYGIPLDQRENLLYYQDPAAMENYAKQFAQWLRPQQQAPALPTFQQPQQPQPQIQQVQQHLRAVTPIGGGVAPPMQHQPMQPISAEDSGPILNQIFGGRPRSG